MTVNPTTGDLTSICTDRAYTFNANGNRTQLATTTRPGGDCATTGTTTTVTTAGWDSADRPTSGRNGAGVYVYDLFGRQTTLPSSDAPNHAGGNITLGYFSTGGANNDGAEAVNGLIELHRRVARGFRNRENYRLRMLLIGGGLAL